MPTNSQFTVAVHILALLAYYDSAMSSKQISNSVNTNPVVVRRIVGKLQDAGLVQTFMGVDGGTALARPISNISLLAVYEATQQGHVLPLHTNTPNPDCPVGANIQPSLSPIYRKAQAALEAELASQTLADVLVSIRTRVSENP